VLVGDRAYKLKKPVDLGFLDFTTRAAREAVLRRELELWLERAAIPQTDARDVVLATWEAGTNAIEHAQDARDQLVRVHAELIGDRLHVEVTDSGRWKPPEERPDRGLGLQLIEALMTFVDIDRSPDGTKVVFAGLQNAVGDIFEVDLNTKEVTNLTKDSFADSGPTWSPDGRLIAYGSDRGSVSGDEIAIVIHDAQTGKCVRRFPAPSMDLYGIDWADE